MTLTADGSDASGQRVQGYVDFTAAATTITCAAGSMGPNSTIAGNSTLAETYAEIMTVQQPFETTEF